MLGLLNADEIGFSHEKYLLLPRYFIKRPSHNHKTDYAK